MSAISSVLSAVVADHEASYGTRMLWPGYWYFMALIESGKENGNEKEEKAAGAGD